MVLQAGSILEGSKAFLGTIPFLALAFLILLSAAAAPVLAGDLKTGKISTDTIFQKLLEKDSDIDHIAITYLFCNPFNTTLKPYAVIEKTVEEANSKSLLATRPVKIQKEMFLINSSRLTWKWKLVKKNVSYYDKELKKNITVEVNVPEKYQAKEEAFVPIVEKTEVAPYSCVKIRQKLGTSLRYRTKPVDLIPVLNLSKFIIPAKDRERFDSSIDGKSKIEARKWVWFNSSWKNRRYILLNSTASVSNYEYLLVMPHYSGMDSNYSDLRFAYEDGTLIPAWLEEYNSTHAKIWLNVSLQSGSNTIYVYYNNSEAEAYWNGFKVFHFFDDFKGSSLNMSIWDERAYNSSYYGGYSYSAPTISNGYAICQPLCNLLGRQNFSNNFVADFLFSLYANGTTLFDKWLTFGLIHKHDYLTDGDLPALYMYYFFNESGNNSNDIGNPYYNYFEIRIQNQWGHLITKKKISDFSNKSYLLLMKRSILLNSSNFTYFENKSVYPIPENADVHVDNTTGKGLKVFFRLHHTYNNKNITAMVDWIRVRSYSNAVITATFGSSEIYVPPKTSTEKLKEALGRLVMLGFFLLIMHLILGLPDFSIGETMLGFDFYRLVIMLLVVYVVFGIVLLILM